MSSSSRLPPSASRLTMPDINALDRQAFAGMFGALFEESPWIAAEAWDSRPWITPEALHAAMLEVVARASQERQIELIKAHPDLVGRAALAGTLSPASTAEQRAAGLDPGALTADELARFQESNRAYQARFGFPFVMCVRESDKDAILTGLAGRLDNDRHAEIATALREIDRIAWNRLMDLVDADPTGDEEFHYEVSYGKQGVPVYRVFAAPLRGVAPIPESAFTGRDNTLLACEVGVDVFGDEFLPAYTHGDNAMVVATDSMKNFIIRETLNYPGATMEGLLHFLGTGFANTYEQMHTLTLSAREIPFAPAVVPREGGSHAAGDNLFRLAHRDRAFASLSIEKRDETIDVTGHECGIRDIELMKLTGSAFTSFLRDGYTTLPERGDRPLYITMDVRWRYTNPDDLLDPTHHRYVPAEQMRDLLAATFDDFVSESIQHLLHEMGQRALRHFPQLAEIRFDALNLTRDPYGQRDDNPRVKVYSDPFPAYGRLTLAIRRSTPIDDHR